VELTNLNSSHSKLLFIREERDDLNRRSDGDENPGVLTTHQASIIPKKIFEEEEWK